MFNLEVYLLSVWLPFLSPMTGEFECACCEIGWYVEGRSMTYRLSWCIYFWFASTHSCNSFYLFFLMQVGVYLEKEVPGVYPSGALNIFCFSITMYVGFFIHKFVAAIFLMTLFLGCLCLTCSVIQYVSVLCVLPFKNILNAFIFYLRCRQLEKLGRFVVNILHFLTKVGLVFLQFLVLLLKFQ